MSLEPQVIAETDNAGDVYASTLREYFRTGSEEVLYRASMLSRAFVERGLGPEEIVAIHVESLHQALTGMSYRAQAHAATDGLQFLLEVMIAYGIQYKEYLDLRVREHARELEDAARSEREKAEILAMIAHELRTPITAASGNLELAERSLQRGLVERVPPLLGSSKVALGRLARLTADLLAASRGESELEREPLDLREVLLQACDWARTAAAEKEISVHLDDGPAVVVRGSADALLSIFGNLLSNAIRYTPAAGRVTVRCGADVAGAWAEVADTGIGMSQEAQERMFERFYRAPEARAIEPQGLGLGLSLVRQLVQAHDGRIEVDSAPGRGSTFRVRLPAAPHGAAEGGDGATA
jgi:two-component system OmpR family sensor kinase